MDDYDRCKEALLSVGYIEISDGVFVRGQNIVTLMNGAVQISMEMSANDLLEILHAGVPQRLLQISHHYVNDGTLMVTLAEDTLHGFLHVLGHLQIEVVASQVNDGVTWIYTRWYNHDILFGYQDSPGDIMVILPDYEPFILNQLLKYIPRIKFKHSQEIFPDGATIN